MIQNKENKLSSEILGFLGQRVMRIVFAESVDLIILSPFIGRNSKYKTENLKSVVTKQTQMNIGPWYGSRWFND